MRFDILTTMTTKHEYFRKLTPINLMDGWANMPHSRSGYHETTLAPMKRTTLRRVPEDCIYIIFVPELVYCPQTKR